MNWTLMSLDFLDARLQPLQSAWTLINWCTAATTPIWWVHTYLVVSLGKSRICCFYNYCLVNTCHER
jgi:hypothetical protein